MNYVDAFITSRDASEEHIREFFKRAGVTLLVMKKQAGGWITVEAKKDGWHHSCTVDARPSVHWDPTLKGMQALYLKYQMDFPMAEHNV